MKNIASTIVLFLCLSFQSLAQSTLGINIHGFVPAGELKQDSPEIWGGGFGVEALFRLKNSPVHLGGQIDLTRYGSEVRDGWHGSGLGDIRVRRNNDIVRALSLVRIKPGTRGNFQPYIDFAGGLSYVVTMSYFREDALSEPFDSLTDLDDLVFNYGIGGGLELFLNDFLSLDLQFRALKGSRARYLTPESVKYDLNTEGYEMTVRESRFDSVTLGLGIKILLSRIDD